MKAKVNRGDGFSGLIAYAFGGENTKRGEIVGGNMAGKNEAALIKEFALVRRLRPDAVRPVWHCSLAMPKNEKLSSGAWNSVCDGFVKKMGFSDFTPYIAVRHSDTDHDHVHIIASRIGIDSKLWLGKWEARTAIEATQILEKEHGLTVTKGLQAERASKKKPSNAEVQIAEKTGDEPPRVRLQRWVDEVVLTRPSALKFAEMLRDRGVTVRANIATTGTMNGFSFSVDGIAFKGSDLGKNYTWSGLQARGVSYDQKRDAALSEYRAGVAPPPVVVQKIDNRLQLQQWIQIEKANKPTAVEFAKLLRARGVIVTANIASTGTMNGFSYVLNGAVFKSSLPGSAYTWSELQRQGISFDKVRDAEGLREFRRVEQVSEKVEAEESVPARPTVPSYDAYAIVRKAHFAAKALERCELKKGHTTALNAVLVAQKVRRTALFIDYDFSGKSELKSIIRSLLAAQQAKEKAALKSKQKAERDALNQRLVFPSYPIWKSANNLPVGMGMPPRFEGKNVRPEISDIRDFVGDVRGTHIHYSSANGASPSAFVDKGREISINDCSRASILASMQLAAQKWGRISIVGGDDAFRSTVVELAYEHGLLLNNDDLRMRVEKRMELARTVPVAPPVVPVPVPVRMVDWFDLTSYGLSVLKSRMGKDDRELLVMGSVDAHEPQLIWLGFERVGDTFRAQLTDAILSMSLWRKAFPAIAKVRVHANDTFTDEPRKAEAEPPVPVSVSPEPAEVTREPAPPPEATEGGGLRTRLLARLRSTLEAATSRPEPEQSQSQPRPGQKQ